MNLFKGPLYLHDSLPPARTYAAAAPRYGATSAWREFAPGLGNRAAAARWFERRGDGDGDRPADVRRVAVAGGRTAKAAARMGWPAACLRTSYLRPVRHTGARAPGARVCASC